MTHPNKLLSNSANATANKNPASTTPPADRIPKATGSESKAADNTREPSAVEAAQAIALSIKKAFRGTVESAKGVVLMTVSDPTALAVSVAAVVDGILRDGAIADLPVCPVSAVTVPHASGSREAEPVRAYSSKNIQAKKLQMAQISHCRRFNPLSPEAVHVLMGYMEPGACVFAQVEYNDLIRDEVIAALAYLNAEAEKLDALIVVYVLCSKKDDTSWLRAHCLVFVEVSQCEPGPGAQAAVVLSNVSVAGWHSQGIGRVMVEAFLGSDSVWTYRSEPFIAERAIIRLAWYLRFKNATVEQIAKLTGINKSNVSRGLDSLLIRPDNSVGLAPPAGWASRWASRYNFDGVLHRKAPSKDTGTGVADETAKAPVFQKTNGVGHIANCAPAPSGVHPVSPNGKP